MQRATRKKRTKRSEIGNSLWDSVADDWKCPACNRLKQEVIRKVDGIWKGGLHQHHDHSVDDPDRHTDKVKFKEVLICDQCNHADGLVKKKFPGIIPDTFSFEPKHMGEFIISKPNKSHKINFMKALELYFSIIDISLIKFTRMWRNEKDKNVERFVIHSTYKRLIRNGTKPSTFFLKEI